MTPDPLTRCRHEMESGHCGHCGAAEMRQPFVTNGRIPAEEYSPTAGEFWTVCAALTLLCLGALAVYLGTRWWPAAVVAIVAGAMILLGLLRLVADGAES